MQTLHDRYHHNFTSGRTKIEPTLFTHASRWGKWVAAMRKIIQPIIAFPREIQAHHWHCGNQTLNLGTAEAPKNTAGLRRQNMALCWCFRFQPGKFDIWPFLSRWVMILCKHNFTGQLADHELTPVTMDNHDQVCPSAPVANHNYHHSISTPLPLTAVTTRFVPLGYHP